MNYDVNVLRNTRMYIYKLVCDWYVTGM